MLETLFGSRTRARLLEWLFMHPDEHFYVRQLEEILDLDSTNISRELYHLLRIGIVSLKRYGRQKHYSTDTESPIFNDLQNLILKTSGLVDVIKRNLVSVEEKIRLAFVYGSVANGSFGAASDIDLIIVGNIKLGEIASMLRKAEQILKREINASVYDSGDFRSRLKEEGFIYRITNGKKLFVIGDEHVLGKLERESLD